MQLRGDRIRGRCRFGLLTLGILVVVAFTQAGCVTTLGYVPEGIKVRQMTQGPATGPTYAEVVTWAEDVADGYDSRATMNRNALYGGALLGVAGASTLAALAIFSAGNPAIAGIPIGTAFVSGTMGFYNNYVRADLYDQASKYVRRLILMSRERRSKASDTNKMPQDIDAHAAVCLEWDVQDVIRIVSRHITMMDPANVAKALAAVKVDAKASDIATTAKDASDAKTDADKAVKKAGDAAGAAKKASDAAGAAKKASDATGAATAAGDAAGAAKDAGDAATEAGDAAKKAAAAAKTASDFAKMASEVAKLLESTQGRFTDLQFDEHGSLPRATHCDPVPPSSK